MSTEELMSYAEGRGHHIVFIPMRKTKAITLEYGGSFVAVSNTVRGTEEKEIVAHEIGHCEYGGTYTRYSPFELTEKAEKRADKWAFYKLIPPGEVRAAFQKGIVEPWDLAEQFDVSCQFMCEALEYYKAVGVL